MKNEKGGTTMNVSTCLNILREIKDVAFATVDENNQPQVRIIDVMLVEDNKLYFCTARGKDFYKQLKNHPYVAITGMNKKYQMVRLNGPVKRLENIPKSKPILNERTRSQVSKVLTKAGIPAVLVKAPSNNHLPLPIVNGIVSKKG